MSETYTGDHRAKKLALLCKRLKRRLQARKNASGKRKAVQ
jgi:hypothetical protein